MGISQKQPVVSGSSVTAPLNLGGTPADTHQLGIVSSGDTKGISAQHSITSGASLGANPLWKFYTSITATDTPNALTLVSQGIESEFEFGDSTHAAVGSAGNLTLQGTVKNVGDANDEHACILGCLRYDMGTGFPVTSPAAGGRAWLMDLGLHGPIGVQSGLLNGITMFANNYYNGSPSAQPSGAIWITTKPGTGTAVDSTHQAATTYPMDVGLGITGTSGAPGVEAGVGFTTGIRIGGIATGWSVSSHFGTGIEVYDWDDYGVHISGRKAGGTGTALAIAEGIGGITVGGSVASSAQLQVLSGSDAEPLVVIGSGETVSVALQMSNASGAAQHFVEKQADYWFPGTVAGDTGVWITTTGKSYHIGGTTRVIQVKKDNTLGFNAATPISKPAVTGSRGANAALASLLTALANYGLITDSSSA